MSAEYHNQHVLSVRLHIKCSSRKLRVRMQIMMLSIQSTMHNTEALNHPCENQVTIWQTCVSGTTRREAYRKWIFNNPKPFELPEQMPKLWFWIFVKHLGGTSSARTFDIIQMVPARTIAGCKKEKHRTNICIHDGLSLFRKTFHGCTFNHVFYEILLQHQCIPLSFVRWLPDTHVCGHEIFYTHFQKQSCVPAHEQPILYKIITMQALQSGTVECVASANVSHITQTSPKALLQLRVAQCAVRRLSVKVKNYAKEVRAAKGTNRGFCDKGEGLLHNQAHVKVWSAIETNPKPTPNNSMRR